MWRIAVVNSNYSINNYKGLLVVISAADLKRLTGGSQTISSDLFGFILICDLNSCCCSCR